MEAMPSPPPLDVMASRTKGRAGLGASPRAAFGGGEQPFCVERGLPRPAGGGTGLGYRELLRGTRAVPSSERTRNCTEQLAEYFLLKLFI